jgi:hypothetical protein
MMVHWNVQLVSILCGTFCLCHQLQAISFVIHSEDKRCSPRMSWMFWLLSMLILGPCAPTNLLQGRAGDMACTMCTAVGSIAVIRVPEMSSRLTAQS